ncbi:hypothetical protein [Bdellovibrio sp. HCB337]|uniref:hypothetical protein n=1 Tax=Bdellovibrio sp. HCB337 TaxID=3394358 RepID=UPI0039A6CF61
MDLFSYQFENQEDRELAFLNIAKWYGDSFIERVETLELTIRPPADLQVATQEIAEKHLGRLK